MKCLLVNVVDCSSCCNQQFHASFSGLGLYLSMTVTHVGLIFSWSRCSV